MSDGTWPRAAVATLTLVVASCATQEGAAPETAGELRPEDGWQRLGAPGFEAAVDTLARQIVSEMDSRQKRAIAILGFVDDSGRESALGRFLAEELTTRLFQVGRFEVIERRMLDRLRDELRLGLSGIVDPRSAKEVGRLLAVDAIVSGTHVDLGELVRVNARLIGTQEGRVFSAAAATLSCDRTAVRMGACGAESSRAVVTGLPGDRARGAVLFQEDFSNVEDGQVPPSWITDDGVGVRRDGRDRALTSLLGGPHKVVIAPLRFSDDFELEILVRYDEGVTVVAGGLTFKIKQKTYAFSPPDTTASLTNASDADLHGGLAGTKVLVTLRKKGPVFRLLLDGREVAISRVSDFHPPESIVLRTSGFRLYRVTLRGLP